MAERFIHNSQSVAQKLDQWEITTIDTKGLDLTIAEPDRPRIIDAMRPVHTFKKYRRPINVRRLGRR